MVKNHKLYWLEKINKVFRTHFEFLRFSMVFEVSDKISKFRPILDQKKGKKWGLGGQKKSPRRAKRPRILLRLMLYPSNSIIQQFKKNSKTL